MSLNEERLRSVLESILLVCGEPIPIQRLVEVIQLEDEQTDAELIKTALDQLIRQYADPGRNLGRGFRIEEVGGGLQLRTVAENAPYVRRVLSARPQRLSRAALETLAIIAYRQPVTKPDVESIRGVDVGGTIKMLLDRDLIRIIGKKDELGRPIVYGTTKYFLEFFGLRALSELPTLREYHELDADHQKAVEAADAARKQKLSDLASLATPLVDRGDDLDLTKLDEAVEKADRAQKLLDAALNGAMPPPETSESAVGSDAESQQTENNEEGSETFARPPVDTHANYFEESPSA